MDQQSLNVGTKVYHPDYGDGVLRQVTLYSLTIFFRNHGDKQLEPNDESLEITEEGLGEPPLISPDEVEMALTAVLEKYTDVSLPVKIADKWKGGKVELKSKDPEQKSKEITIDTLFHKIVLVREKLRVLEQNINSQPNLTDQEKVQLQQYITKAYGTLTTFNVLFKEESDTFKGQKS